MPNPGNLAGALSLTPAPALNVVEWFNTVAPLNLDVLRGRVVVLHAFQMLCPGCVYHGIPQAQRIHQRFDTADVAVIGLHTVFEHHDVMSPRALEVFIHENRLAFPIGIDAHDGENQRPVTMRAYKMKGTPTLVLIDRQGNQRFHLFGQESDLGAGAAIGQLLREPA
jgi:thiol-disulfide isomerase/thioredoxin